MTFVAIQVLESRVLFAGSADLAPAAASAVEPAAGEPRTGNVTAAVGNGVLTIRGDRAGNVLALTSDPAGGVRLTGGGATTVNGAAGAALFAAAARGVRVSLGEGDDRLTVTGVVLPGEVRVDAGRGAGQVSLQSAGVRGRLRIAGRSGPETVELRSATVNGRTDMGTGSQADRVTLADSTFAGRVTVRTGRGDDAVVQQSVFNGGVRVKDGPGHDAVNLTKNFDFRDGDEGRTTGFADYPPGVQATDADGRPIDAAEYYDLESGLRPLPADLGTDGTGFMLGGNNRSDDLFMFLKRGLGPSDGIVPGQAYELRYMITFASNAPSNSVGIGGPPGEAVYLHAGGATIDPVPVLVPVDGTRRMNVDIDARRAGKRAVSLVSNIANGIGPQPYPLQVPYVSLTRSNVHRFPITAGREGQLWMLIGTDSNYEGRTEIYYEHVEVTLVATDGSRA